VLYASGNQNSGLSVFIQNDRLVFDYNCFGEHHVAESDIDVPVGESVVGVRFRGSAGRGGHAALVIDGAKCGSVDIPFVMLKLSSIGPSVASTTRFTGQPAICQSVRIRRDIGPGRYPDRHTAAVGG